MSEVLGHPLKILDIWVISPLTLGGDSLDSVLCYADQHDAVRVSNMGSIGSTLPVNIGDVFVVSIAEVIGSPESTLLGILSGQVNAFMHGRRWYPEMAHCMMTIAKLPGAHSCTEKANGMTTGTIFGRKSSSTGVRFHWTRCSVLSSSSTIYKSFQGSRFFRTIIEMENVSNKASRRSWARLIQKVYEVDPLLCPKCGHELKVIAVITEPGKYRHLLEVRKILEFLKRNHAPPFTE
jgi:hypothetical protein